MKKIIFTLSLIIGGFVACFAQKAESDTLVQVTASKIIIHDKQLKNDSNRGYIIVESFKKEGNTVIPSGIVATYDKENKCFIVVGENKDDEVKMSFIKSKNGSY